MAAHRFDDGFVPSRDGTRLYWQSRHVPEPRAHVAVVHGFFDHSGRFENIFAPLAAAGISAHGFDYRGHGKSSGKRGDARDFREFGEDLEAFLGLVRPQLGDKPLFIFAQSHGALVSAHWILGTRPEGIAGTIFSSPWLRNKVPPPKLQLFLAKTVGRLLPAMSVRIELDATLLSHDVEVQQKAIADPLYGHHVTPRWNVARERAQEEVLRRASEFVLPLLVLVGTDDHVADPLGAREFVGAATSPDKELREYPGFRHEPFNEIGREQVLGDVVNWLERHISRAKLAV